MKSLKQLVNSSFFLAIFVFASFTNAQTNAVVTPYSNEHVRGVFENNITRASSNIDMGLIPPNKVYREIFRRILLGGEFDRALTDGDILIIEALPSHNHELFQRTSLAQYKEVCNAVEATQSRNNSQIQQLAALFEQAKHREEEVLNKHYERVLASLSETGKQYIAQRLVAMSETEALGYADLDLAGVSIEIPLVAEQVLEQFCINFPEIEAANSEIVESLAESRSLYVPISATQSENNN